jgi:hypothetical protein
MRAGAYERGILDSLSARDKSDSAAQQLVKWSPERVMIGKRTYPYLGTVQSESHSSACHGPNLFPLG